MGKKNKNIKKSLKINFKKIGVIILLIATIALYLSSLFV